MRIVVILDVSPVEGEPRRNGDLVMAEVESELEANGIDVPNEAGMSLHQIKVAGIGKTVAEAQTSLAQRKQYARQD